MNPEYLKEKVVHLELANRVLRAERDAALKELNILKQEITLLQIEIPSEYEKRREEFLSPL